MPAIRNILLMTADEGNGGAEAAEAARAASGPGRRSHRRARCSAPSVSAVAPIARDRGVPVLAFSTEKSVAGNGAYLLSFLPQNEVRRVVRYAAANGHQPVRRPGAADRLWRCGAGASATRSPPRRATSVDVERFAPNAGAVAAPASAVAKSGADAVLIAQGGSVLRAIAPTLSLRRRDARQSEAAGHRTVGR